MSERLTFFNDIRGGFFDITTPGTTGTALQIVHSLGYTPTGFIIVRQEGAGHIYAMNVTSWDDESIYIGSDTADLDARIFVM